jgi:hypothetical protein
MAAKARPAPQRGPRGSVPVRAAAAVASAESRPLRRDKMKARLPAGPFSSGQPCRAVQPSMPSDLTQASVRPSARS